MQLDWFTIIAQVVNFLILVALLKRFLYGPIIRAMDTREEHIAARLEQARTQITQAEQQAAAYTAERNALQESKETMLQEAKSEADAQRQHLFDQARQEVQQLQERWQHTLQQEQAAFLQDVRAQVGEHICTIARRALTDLAGVELEQAMLDRCLTHLRQVDETERRALITAAGQGGMVVRSAFPLSQESQQRLLHEIRASIAPDLAIRFVTNPDLVCGLELEAHGRKIAWHVEQYIDSLEAHIRATVMQEPLPQTASA